VALALLGVWLRCAAAPAAAAQTPGDPGEWQPFKLDLPDSLDQERPRHVGRSAIESAAALGGWTIWYWRDLDFNARDWQLHWDVPSWKRKLTGFDAVRLDQNTFDTNARDHPLAGMAAYHIARGNGLGAGTSVIVTFGSAVVWEYLIEFKELVALNDLVENPAGGFALGEPLYQLGEFFQRGSPTLFNRALAGALSPVASMNDWVDGRVRPREAVDALGFTREVWHRFQLTSAFGATTYDRGVSRGGTDIGAGADLVMLRGYGNPGSFARRVRPGDFSLVSTELETGPAGVVGGTALTHTSVLGRYWQRLARDAGGRLHGTGFLLGLGSGFEYWAHDRLSGRDFLVAMNLLGPMWELTGRRDGVRLRWRGQVLGDFAMVKSLAFEGLMPPTSGEVYHPGDYGGDFPGPLGAHGYYHALGVTAGTRLELEYWGWDAGAQARGDHFDSIEGLDRFQEELTRDLHLIDRRLTTRLWLGVRPWGRWARVGAGLDWHWRQGLADMDGLEREYFDRRAYLSLSLVF
jgi:hypothetical protein